MKVLETKLEYLHEIFAHQPEAVVFVEPVWQNDSSFDEGKIIDFQFAYCNAAIEALNGKSADELVGKRILTDRLPDPGFNDVIFQQCLQVYQTGEPMQHTYYSTELEKYVTLQRVKFQGGVLTTARNRTAEYHSRLEKEHQTRLLQSIIENSPYGICLYQSVRNQAGEIQDFKLRLCNQKSAEITAFSLQELHTHTVKELMVIRGHSNYFDICSQVVTSGEPHYTEYYSSSRDQWLGFSIVKFDDGYLLNYIDITKTKRLEAQANRIAQELGAIFDGSLSGVYSARVVKNKEERVCDLVFLRANKGFYKLFSLSEQQTIGCTLLSISGKDKQETFLSYVDAVITTGEPAVHTIHYQNPERWFEFSVAKLDEETVSVTVNDITNQQLATSEIRRQKNLLDNILRQSPSGLSITKAIRNEYGEMIDAIAVLMNEACERYNGVPNEVLLNHSMGALDPSILTSPLFEAAKALRVGETYRTEYFLSLTNRWLELAVAKMDDDHFINVFTDVTATKENQLQMQKMVEELQQSNKMLEDFAYAASHDLKEPLRKIQFFADRLQAELRHQLNEVQTGLFQRMERSAGRMQRLIDDLLSYSFISKGAKELESINLNEKIDTVLEDLALVVQEKGAKISTENLPTILGHRRQVQQLFYNLLSNGLKYSKPDVAPAIQITCEKVSGKDLRLMLPLLNKESTYYVIKLKDNGIGFAEENAERIFNVFTRLHGNHEYSGTGVGLAIAKKVVENHHGAIYAQGSLEKGAEFTIVWPI